MLELRGFLALACICLPCAAALARADTSVVSHKQMGIAAGQVGLAAVYSHKYDDRRMASGIRFNPRSNAAASRSLQIGTVAKVTNRANGRTTTVKVEDRGPHVKGHVMDISPKSAEQLGITKKKGVAPVVVSPLRTPGD